MCLIQCENSRIIIIMMSTVCIRLLEYTVMCLDIVGRATLPIIYCCNNLMWTAVGLVSFF